MKRISFIALALTPLPLRAAPPPATPVQTISYEAGPCFGGCPTYRFHINSNGSGIFEGIRFTAVTGTRPFHTTPAQYRAFEARLAADRPAQGERRFEPGSPLCRQVATDAPSVHIVWRGRIERRLSVYLGCDMAANRAMFERLVSAPLLLPIGDFIGRAR
jgi:hypothetical protein